MVYFRNLFILFLLIILALPLMVVFGVSLNEPKQLVFPPEGLSFDWYWAIFSEAEWFNALQNSLVIALLASIFAVSVATPIAIYLWKVNSWFARILFSLGVTPFIIPPVILALGFMTFWIFTDFYGNIFATIISHGVFFVTLPLVTITLGLQSIDKQYLEAANMMGATESQVFKTVVLPLIVPYIISGFLFAFVLSLNEYIIAYMVAGFTAETLPIKIFNSLRYGYTPVMAAIASLFVGLAAIVFSLVAKYGDLLRLLGAERTK